MPKKLRPYMLTIGGFDPSNGAGIGADIKTFEQLKTIGLSVLTCNTIQTEDSFSDVQWVSDDFVLAQIEALTSRYKVRGIKIGLVKNLEQLNTLLDFLRKNTDKAIITWDPILSATAGFEFHPDVDQNLFLEVLSKIDLITPNAQEILKLTGSSSIEESVKELNGKVNLLLKGGHIENAKGIDHLYWAEKEFTIKPRKLSRFDKHGTGCVTSSCMTVFLAQGYPPVKSLLKTKNYIERLLDSNPTLLGYHKF